MLDKAYTLGIRYFDTAPSYGKGEAFLQKWHDANSFPDVVLGTKWGYTYVANWELGFNGKHEVKEHSLEKLLQQWQVSKALLPNLKYYQVHSATFESGILENTKVLNQLFKIKEETGLQIGVTTSGVNQNKVIETALNIEVGGKSLFDSFQVTYNVLEQATFLILKKMIAAGKTVIIKEALANGRVFQNEDFPHYQSYYKLLNQLSKKYKVGVDAIAIRFVIDSLAPKYVLSGASSFKQLKENMKALTFKLSDTDLEVLKKINITPKDYWEERSSLIWN